LDGRQVAVHEVEYSQTIAGVGNAGVVVDIGGSGQGAGAASIGFANEADAMDYLTTLDAQEYTVFDRNGGRITETRVGLGIPDGMIRRIDTRVGGDPGAAREALATETGKTDPKHDGDGNDSGPKNDKEKNKS